MQTTGRLGETLTEEMVVRVATLGLGTVGNVVLPVRQGSRVNLQQTTKLVEGVVAVEEQRIKIPQTVLRVVTEVPAVLFQAVEGVEGVEMLSKGITKRVTGVVADPVEAGGTPRATMGTMVKVAIQRIVQKDRCLR